MGGKNFRELLNKLFLHFLLLFVLLWLIIFINWINSVEIVFKTHVFILHSPEGLLADICAAIGHQAHLLEIVVGEQDLIVPANPVDNSDLKKTHLLLYVQKKCCSTENIS